MKKFKKLTAELEDSFNRWEHLKVHGGQDPCWADGCNMNLVRNHIFSYKRQIKELCEEKGLKLPQIFFREEPPKMDNDYMARADEIRENARKALEKYKEDENYKYLVKIVIGLNKKQIEKTAINNVINYCHGLKSFIEKDDLVAMRRHERYEGYIESFRSCRGNVEEILAEEPEEGQVSLFEYY